MVAAAFRDLASNPLFMRLTRRAGWPDNVACLRIAGVTAAAGAGLIVALVAADPLARRSPLDLPLTNLVLMFSGALRIVGALGLSVLIASRTTRAINQGEFSLIHVSRMTNSEIVEGLVTAGLYRLRFLWSVMAGLIVPVFLANLYQSLRVMRPVYLCDANMLDCLGRGRAEMVALQAVLIVVAMAVDALVYIGWIALTGYASVWVALWRRSGGAAPAGALLSLATAIGLFLAESVSAIDLSTSPLPSSFPAFGFCGSGLFLPLLLISLKEHALARVRAT